jgi:hypothetical protein
MNADELIGQLAVVHPELTKDPAGKSGQVGIITGTELENDNIYVGFGRNGQGLYGTDALATVTTPGRTTQRPAPTNTKQELSLLRQQSAYSRSPYYRNCIPTTAKHKNGDVACPAK